MRVPALFHYHHSRCERTEWRGEGALEFVLHSRPKCLMAYKLSGFLFFGSMGTLQHLSLVAGESMQMHRNDASGVIGPWRCQQ